VGAEVRDLSPPPALLPRTHVGPFYEMALNHKVPRTFSTRMRNTRRSRGCGLSHQLALHDVSQLYSYTRSTALLLLPQCLRLRFVGGSVGVPSFGEDDDTSKSSSASSVCDTCHSRLTPAWLSPTRLSSPSSTSMSASISIAGGGGRRSQSFFAGRLFAFAFVRDSGAVVAGMTQATLRPRAGALLDLVEQLCVCVVVFRACLGRAEQRALHQVRPTRARRDRRGQWRPALLGLIPFTRF
jgi:hypothetical protein